MVCVYLPKSLTAAWLAVLLPHLLAQSVTQTPHWLLRNTLLNHLGLSYFCQMLAAAWLAVLAPPPGTVGDPGASLAAA
jgi:hypothetical protein